MRRRSLLVPGIVLALLLVAAGGALAAVSLAGGGDDEAASAGELRVLPVAERERILDRLLPGLEPFIDRLLPEGERDLPRPRQQPFVGIVLDEEDGEVVVERVVQGSPASRAGMREGDVIEAVDDTPVQDPAEVAELVRGSERGDLLTFHVRRDGEEHGIEVRVGQRPVPVEREDRGPRSLLPEGPLELFDGPLLRERLGELLDGLLLRERLGELFERFIGASVTFLDEDGERATLQVVAGAIAEVSDGTVVVAPNGGGSPQEFTLTEDTRIVRGLRPADADDLAPGDLVVVVARDEGKEALALLAIPGTAD